MAKAGRVVSADKLKRMRLQLNQVLFAAVLVLTSARPEIRAASAIETSGDVLQFVLPAAASALTLYHGDWDGALQLGESEALTLGVTYGLKYTVRHAKNYP